MTDNTKIKTLEQYTRDDLIGAVADLVDGSQWWDIKYNTGCSEERCKEIAQMGQACTNHNYGYSNLNKGNVK